MGGLARQRLNVVSRGTRRRAGAAGRGTFRLPRHRAGPIHGNLILLSLIDTNAETCSIARVRLNDAGTKRESFTPPARQVRPSIWCVMKEDSRWSIATGEDGGNTLIFRIRNQQPAF